MIIVRDRRHLVQMQHPPPRAVPIQRHRLIRETALPIQSTAKKKHASQTLLPSSVPRGAGVTSMLHAPLRVYEMTRYVCHVTKVTQTATTQPPPETIVPQQGHRAGLSHPSR